MTTHQPHHPTVALSPKEALRAYVEQMPLEQQREFVAAALEVIATRPVLGERCRAARSSRPSHHWAVLH